MKELESIKVTLATVMAIKLDWRLAVAVLGGVLAFFYAEMKEVRQELSRIGGELVEIKTLLRQNLAQQGGGNFTIDEATLRAIMHPTSTGEVPIIPIYVYVASKFVHTYGKSATRGVASKLPEFNTPNSTPTTNPTQRS